MANALNVKIGGDIRGLQNALSNATVAIQNVGRQMTQVGKTMSTRVTAPIVAGFGFAIKAASDAEETIAKFATVFKDVEKESERAFRVLRNEYGLSSTAAKELLGNTGDLLTGFGFTGAEALRLSEEVNKLAVDLASFTNFSGGAAGASAALTKALLGERESVKSLGISILEEDVKKQMAINTTKGLTFATERQAKAQATLDLAIQQSQNAIGDYERTSGSFANQMRLLRARTNDLAVEFGTMLLPAATEAISKIENLVTTFSNLDDAQKRIILNNALLVASIGPVLIILGKLTKALAFVLSAIGIKVVAILSLVSAFIYVSKNLKAFRDFYVRQFVIMKNNLVLSIAGMIDALDGFLSYLPYVDAPLAGARDAILGLIEPIPEIENEFQGLGEFMGDVASDIANLAKRLGNNLFGDLFPKEEADKFKTSIERASIAVNGFQAPAIRLVEGGKSIKKMFQSTAKEAENLGNALQSSLSSAIVSFAQTVGDAFTGDGGASGFFNNILLVVADFMGALGRALVAAGIAAQAFQKLLTNPIGAIIAGGALIAASAVVRNLLTKGPATSVNDALITSDGKVIKFHPDDNILAMKDFSNLGGGGGSQKVIVSGMINGKDILLSNARSERSFR